MSKYLLPVGYTVTLNDKQYSAVETNRYEGLSCSLCDITLDCSQIKCHRYQFKANISIHYKRARESFPGRRAIKSDYRTGAKLYRVGYYEGYYIEPVYITKYHRGNNATANLFKGDNVFTTRRAAEAYRNMRHAYL